MVVRIKFKRLIIIVVSHNQHSLIIIQFIHSTIFTALDCGSGTVLGARDRAVSRVLPPALAEVVENSGHIELPILFLIRKLNSMYPGAKGVYGVK